MSNQVAHQFDDQSEVVIECLVQFLRPIVKLFIKFRVGFPIFVAVLRRLYVELAQEQLIISQPDKRVTKSALSAVTGININAVGQELHAFEESETSQSGSPKMVPICPEAAVLSMWAKNPLYLKDSGEPRELKVYGSGISFQNLVKGCLREAGYQPVLSQLLNSGNIQFSSDQKRIKLISRAYAPAKDDALETLRVAARSVRRYTSTLLVNVVASIDGTKKLLQQELMTKQLDPKNRNQFQDAMRNLLDQQINNAVDAMETWEEPTAQDNHVHAGIGYYVFDETPETRLAYERFFSK